MAHISLSPPVRSNEGRALATREAILGACERLFMQHGHEATPLRQIAREAGVNLAATHYHFGSKEALIQTVLKRRLAALNTQRLAALDALEHEAQGAPLKPSQIVDAFFGTLLRMANGSQGPEGRNVLALLERTMSDPASFVHAFISREYMPVLDRFRDALFRALPQVPREEIIWRFQFMLGATSYAIVGPCALYQAAGLAPTDSQANHADAELTLRLPRLMSFLMGGLRAPLPAHPPPQG